MGLNEAAWMFLPRWFKIVVVVLLRLGAIAVFTLWLIMTLMKAGIL